MSIKGYVDYKRREFCKDVKCPVQLQLDAQKEGSEEYEKTRQTCKTNCRRVCVHTNIPLINFIIG
jgi:hypothetical protein